MPTETEWKLIDFHTHVRPPWWKPIPLAGIGQISEQERARLVGAFAKMTDIDQLIRETEGSGVSFRLLSAPIEGYFGTEGPTDIDLIRRINDFLAETQRKHPQRLAALATIDAFSGEVGALEVERAVKHLGHVGIVIDSSRDQHFLGHPSVRPTLAAAAALKVPVFVHPVGASNSDVLAREGGRTSYALGRGSVNGHAFLSLLRSGLLEELPDLHIVFTALGVGALIVAASEGGHYSGEEKGPAAKPNVYFDIMGLHPPTIRYLVDVLGADRVLLGSDWPIWTPVSQAVLARAFARAGLTAEQQQLIAEGNTRRLLGLARR